MNLSELARAVYQRIKSDTGAGGLLNNPDGLPRTAGSAATTQPTSRPRLPTGCRSLS